MEHMRRQSHRLAAVDAFKDLPNAELDELDARLELLNVPRGAHLVREGDSSDALYIVVSGRFEVTVAARNMAVAQIGSGHPIGEIAFFAGGKRTATVTAIRDSLVLKLGRAEFSDLCERTPAMWRTVMATLAQRLAAATSGRPEHHSQKPATITILQAGHLPIPPVFMQTLRDVFCTAADCYFLDHDTALQHLPAGADLASPEATRVLNELEGRHDHLIYLADTELTPWSEKAIRQADLVLMVGMHAPNRPARRTPSKLEEFADALHPTANLKLVLLHARAGAISGTARWLQTRNVHMHHHVALRRRADYERLYRFVSGTALGLVACGGGALCCTQVGLYKAIIEAGVTFDILGGTSGGGAMTAAFAAGVDPDDIDAQVHEIFVAQKALRRYTWPRYSLVDHSLFDELLEKHYTNIDIEDLWVPYFAVSTNLSNYSLQCHRTGPLWHTVRATGSIPALLPPFYTDEGEMLVDGSLLDNVPIKTMHDLKDGPNVVITFEMPTLELFDVDYATLPSRGELVWRTASPITRARLPEAPSIASVLMRALMANRHNFEQHLAANDLLLMPPIPPSVGFMDWTRHGELMELGLRYGREEMERLRQEAHALLDTVSNAQT